MQETWEIVIASLRELNTKQIAIWVLHRSLGIEVLSNLIFILLQ